MAREISADLVKRLRAETGAGMMACKQALQEADGDLERARDILRTKGMASAEKRAGRTAKQGLIEAYVHPGGGLGALVEVNCETDFVARTDEFRSLAHDLALQVVSFNPRWVRREDVPAAELEHERAVNREQALAEGRAPERIDQIIEGRLRKFYETVCLYDQPWLRDQGSKPRPVREVIQEVSASTGENIFVSRFARYQLGETAAEAADGG